MIQVLEQHSSGWTYAKNLSLSSSANAGWVPSWIVQPAQQTGAAEATQPKQKAAETTQKEPARTQPAQPAAAQQATPAAPQAQAAQPAQPQAQTALATEARNVIRANAAFAATSASQLTVSPGELVEIFDRHASGWTYGRKVSESGSDAGAGLEGWFPHWVVAPVCPQK
uniref:SH3 domain-containing protein n=1 Tax=Alexandrium andersonii TaxID=327968 RepID=A0A7S2GCZ0_9DINO